MKDDVISRQAAIEAIEQLNIPDDMCVFEILSHIQLAIGTLPSAQPEKMQLSDEDATFDCISRQTAIDALQSYSFPNAPMVESGIKIAINLIETLPSAQPEQQNKRIFQEIIVEYPTISTYPEYEGKPYFSIKYTENGQEFIGYGTYKPEVLSEYLKEYFMPSVQPRWIPVTEKLPEDLEAVNITWVNHEPEPYYHDIKDKNFVATGIHYRDKWYWYSTTCADFLGEYGSNEVEEVDDAVEIIAWMPLPEPYKEGQE